MRLSMTLPFCSVCSMSKSSRKTELKDYLAKTQGIVLDDNSIYDIQIKRLHEYKRQQMNALYVIHKYFEIKAGKKPTRPITVIFGQGSSGLRDCKGYHSSDPLPVRTDCKRP